jgi:hypothetical protein
VLLHYAIEVGAELEAIRLLVEEEEEEALSERDDNTNTCRCTRRLTPRLRGRSSSSLWRRTPRPSQKRSSAAACRCSLPSRGCWIAAARRSSSTRSCADACPLALLRRTHRRGHVPL